MGSFFIFQIFSRDEFEALSIKKISQVTSYLGTVLFLREKKSYKMENNTFSRLRDSCLEVCLIP